MICEALQKDIAVMHKSSAVDLVTETDQKVEQLIISSIREKYPTHSFIGEESVAAGAPSALSDNPTWIIDPIDGTTNFVHRFPFVSVSIGFTVKKEIEFGIVYSCIEDKMYTARKGKGAFCNGVPIKVSGQEDISKSLVLTEMGFKKDAEQFQTMMANIRNILSIPVHGIRSPGSAAVNMCLVACGSADAYYHMGIHCWDMAGGAAVVREAGGVIMDISVPMPKNKPSCLNDYRPIALTSVVMKVFERLLKNIISSYIPSTTDPLQFAYRQDLQKMPSPTSCTPP
ncbi:NADH dehydrogenase (ubiquinone) 1 alpha subcomplex subunit 2 [Sarotherodon galilaeus]